ncbi:MAG: hypothetical protein V3U76_00350 [Granulosicoccus sp.]
MISNLKKAAGHVLAGITLITMLAACNSSSKSDADADANSGEAPARSAVDNGYVVSSLESFDSAGALEDSYEYVIDYDENTISMHDVQLPERPVETLYKYDTNGYLSDVTRYRSGEIDATEKYEWDTNDRLQSITNEITIDTRTIQIIYQFAYDENNRIISRQKQFVDSGDVETASFTYDANGNLASVIHTGNDELTTFSYNEQNQRTGAILTLDGEDFTATTQYDANGNIMSTDETDQSGELFYRGEFTYEVASEPVPNLLLFSQRYFPDQT